MTLSWQWVENTGHILSDGTFLPLGQSVTTSVLAEVDYGVTERFAATVGVPFIFAKYTGDTAPISGLPVDTCRCWNSTFQDLSIAGRYRFGDEFWALTPSVRLIMPTHGYAYQGEAVVGPKLRQMLVGITGTWRLVALPKASIEAGYSYALVQKPTPDTSANRSNVAASFGYALTRSLYVHGGALFQKIHGGLTDRRVGHSATRSTGHKRIAFSMRYWHMTGGVSYSTGFADVFFAVQPYVWGRDTHDGIAYTVGSTWYFDFSRPKP